MTYDDKLRFGTVGTPQTTPGTGTIAAIEHIAQLGLHHLEIAWTRSVRVSDETCAEIKATAEKHGISLSVHAPYFINLNSQTDELMVKSDERLLTAARKGCLAGAKDIVFHPGSYHTQDKFEVYKKAAAQLKKLRQILDDEGVDAILRPETMGKSAMFGSLEETIRLSAEIEGVLPCVDWAHLHARTGDGSFNSTEEFAQALDKMRAELGDEKLKQVHFHMSGIAYTPKGEKEHLPLIEADILYRELMQVFVDYNLEGTVAVEAPKPFHTADALHLQATYRRAAE